MIIGTASIVVMISLGMGLQRSLYEEVEQSGGLTMLTVTGKSAGDAMTYYGGEEDDTTKNITDDTIKEIAGVEHVTLAAPVYEMSAYALKGKYMGHQRSNGSTEYASEGRRKLSEGGRQCIGAGLWKRCTDAVL